MRAQEKARYTRSKMDVFEQLREGKALIFAPREKKVSKKLPVFYNPVMKLNRDISILLLNSLGKKGMQIALPLAGTGVRGIRFALELKRGTAKSISMNDMSDSAVDIIKKNIKLNKIKSKNISVSKKDANIFMLESLGFDYIDIDPFGTPNYFLDSAVKRISRQGILAVTATDTSALAGSFADACIRKYWAVPLANELMHEAGIRILIRKVQLIGAQFDKALTPIFSYADQHYMRVFFSCEKGKHKVDSLLKQHSMSGSAGPMWTGRLWDSRLASAIAEKSGEKMLKMIADESKIDSFGFYDVHQVCKRNKISLIPKFSLIMDEIRKKKFSASLTHFSPNGIRTNVKEKDFESIVRKLSLKL